MENGAVKVLAMVLAAFGATPVSAQTQEDHAQRHGGQPPAAEGLAMSGADPDGSAMDHGDTKMREGSAPADARDPDAYSGGHTLESGAYALPGPRQLRLSDEHSFGALLVDRLERVFARDANATAYDVQAWFGGDYDRAVLKAEGDVARRRLQDARTEVLWGHVRYEFTRQIGSARPQTWPGLQERGPGRRAGLPACVSGSDRRPGAFASKSLWADQICTLGGNRTAGTIAPVRRPALNGGAASTWDYSTHSQGAMQ